VLQSAADPGWRLTVNGPAGAVAFSLAQLQRMPQHTADLPIACVEGWARDASWSGVRLSDLLTAAGAASGSTARVSSLDHGLYGRSDVPASVCQDPLTLVALAQRAAAAPGPWLSGPADRTRETGCAANEVAQPHRCDLVKAPRRVSGTTLIRAVLLLLGMVGGVIGLIDLVPAVPHLADKVTFLAWFLTPAVPSDALLMPAAAVIGLAAGRLLPRWLRSPVVAGVVLSAAMFAIALPFLGRPVCGPTTHRC
jgi:hypothetical protein